MNHHQTQLRSQLALSILAIAMLLSGCGTLFGDRANDHQGSAASTAPAGVSTSCATLGSWPDTSAQLEAEVLTLINQRRASGASCGSEGSFGPKPALVAEATLTCVARAFAKDMDDNHFFSHTDQNGKSPFDRMNAAGLNYSEAAENIAEGQTTPEDVVQSWMTSDGHCANIMGDTQRTGIGFVNNVWVQDFATLR